MTKKDLEALMARKRKLSGKMTLTRDVVNEIWESTVKACRETFKHRKGNWAEVCEAGALKFHNLLMKTPVGLDGKRRRR